MSVMSLSNDAMHWSPAPPAFDDPDQLNEDGSVTLRIIPSNWRRYNISPDTYQLVNGDSWENSELDHYNEYPPEHAPDRRLDYDDFDWQYDHTAIVRSFGETLVRWVTEQMEGLGVTVRDPEIRDSWSPKEYNFVSDGFEMEFTCDPAELRALSGGFDVDEWVFEWYRSCDGFMSYVPRRMDDDDWRRDYDGEFRVEYILSMLDPKDDGGWRYALYEDEDQVYTDHTIVTFINPEYMDSGYTLPELIEWALALTPTQPETLFDHQED